MCDPEFEDICPTALSAVLLRLFHVETGKPCAFNALDLLRQWTKKIDDPDASDDWITSSALWRLYARHIHALVAVNAPCIADSVAYELGIDSPRIPWPKVVVKPDGTSGEHYSSPQHYGRCLPPFGFETWQSPLALTKDHPCEEDHWFESDENLLESEQPAEV